MQNKIIQIIEETMKTHPRYEHSLGLKEMALSLNQTHHLEIPEDQIWLAAMLHDIAKPISKEKSFQMMKENFDSIFDKELQSTPSIWHAFIGSVIAKKEYHIQDEMVLKAIQYHTTGRPNMTSLEKIIFLSDYIELGRKGSHFEKVRAIAKKDIELAIVQMLDQVFQYLEKNKEPIYSLSIQTYAYYKREVENGK